MHKVVMGVGRDCQWSLLILATSPLSILGRLMENFGKNLPPSSPLNEKTYITKAGPLFFTKKVMR